VGNDKPLEEKIMKETTQSHPQNVGAKTKDIATHLSTERMTEQEAIAAKSLKSNPPMLQRKADPPAGSLTEKRKRRCIPFVALALVLV
jgi:hypothetical protein